MSDISKEGANPTEEESNWKDECIVSKASSEIMLGRICINDQKEFPFLNFL